MSRPPPKRARTIKMLEPRLTAPMAVALLGSRPTIMVSTMAMLIQPSSARTRGTASRKVGRNSARSVWSASMVEDKRNEFKRSGQKEQTGASRVTIEENGVVSEMGDAIRKSGYGCVSLWRLRQAALDEIGAFDRKIS